MQFRRASFWINFARERIAYRAQLLGQHTILRPLSCDQPLLIIWTLTLKNLKSLRSAESNPAPGHSQAKSSLPTICRTEPVSQHRFTKNGRSCSLLFCMRNLETDRLLVRSSPSSTPNAAIRHVLIVFVSIGT